MVEIGEIRVLGRVAAGTDITDSDGRVWRALRARPGGSWKHLRFDDQEYDDPEWARLWHVPGGGKMVQYPGVWLRSRIDGRKRAVVYRRVSEAPPGA